MATARPTGMLRLRNGRFRRELSVLQAPAKRQVMTHGRRLARKIGSVSVMGVSRLLAITLAIGFAVGVAAAHEGMDPLSAWYRSLTTVDGKSCCSMRDCGPVE